jgi:hypothetical protein
MTKKPGKKRPAKVPDLLGRIKVAVENGTYFDMTHAQERSIERQITRPEYEYVLINGYHEKKKDDYKEKYKAWNYAIRGKTIDKRSIRVVVSFDKNDLLVITVIDLDVED